MEQNIISRQKNLNIGMKQNYLIRLKKLIDGNME